MAQTYNELYISMRRRLREAQVDESGLEARRLLALADDCSDSDLIARFSLYATSQTIEKAEKLLYRRLAGEPLAYISGWWEFHGQKIIVSPAVLIPRVDTEILVEAALRLIRPVNPAPRILDLCCGSGCITCALGAELPSARFVLADISTAALSVARRNLSLHRLNTRSICLDADALSPPPLRMDNFDLICCNPPYVTPDEIEKLDPSVKDWEPILALDGGEDGLVFYRSVLENWMEVLRPGGYLVFEVGEGQAEKVKDLMRSAGLKNISGTLDTGGTERVVFGKKEETNIL